MMRESGVVGGGGGGGGVDSREAFIVTFKIEPVRILISWCKGNR